MLRTFIQGSGAAAGVQFIVFWVSKEYSWNTHTHPSKDQTWILRDIAVQWGREAYFHLPPFFTYLQVVTLIMEIDFIIIRGQKVLKRLGFVFLTTLK